MHALRDRHSRRKKEPKDKVFGSGCRKRGVEFKSDCSRASTRKICPKRGPRKSHEKATKRPRLHMFACVRVGEASNPGPPRRTPLKIHPRHLHLIHPNLPGRSPLFVLHQLAGVIARSLGSGLMVTSGCGLCMPSPHSEWLSDPLKVLPWTSGFPSMDTKSPLKVSKLPGSC